MSVEELTREALELIQLRQDNAALRVALERVTEERNQWRDAAQQAQHRHQQAVFLLHATIKELFA